MNISHDILLDFMILEMSILVFFFFSKLPVYELNSTHIIIPCITIRGHTFPENRAICCGVWCRLHQFTCISETKTACLFWSDNADCFIFLCITFIQRVQFFCCLYHSSVDAYHMDCRLCRLRPPTYTHKQAAIDRLFVV